MAGRWPPWRLGPAATPLGALYLEPFEPFGRAADGRPRFIFRSRLLPLKRSRAPRGNRVADPAEHFPGAWPSPAGCPPPAPAFDIGFIPAADRPMPAMPERLLPALLAHGPRAPHVRLARASFDPAPVCRTTLWPFLHGAGSLPRPARRILLVSHQCRRRGREATFPTRLDDRPITAQLGRISCCSLGVANRVWYGSDLGLPFGAIPGASTCRRSTGPLVNHCLRALACHPGRIVHPRRGDWKDWLPGMACCRQFGGAPYDGFHACMIFPPTRRPATNCP